MTDILVVGQDFPWPPTSGSLLRLINVISALSQLGQVDLFSTISVRRDSACVLPEAAPVARSATAPYVGGDYSVVGRAAWAFGRLPHELGSLDFAAATSAFQAWARDRYDLVWFSKAMTYVGLGRPDLGPTVVDLDDLEDHKILARLGSGAFATEYPRTLAGRLHRLGAGWQGRENARRWARLQRSIASAVSGVVLCSDLDATRLGAGNTWIVPNGYEVPPEPAGSIEVGRPPSLLFQGLLAYPPNADAARWLVEEIAPRVRARVPDAEVRLVGTPSPPVRRLADPPRVRVMGRVPEMEPELRMADVATVPVRYGSGTRVKILEAFAHRIPVVSTSIGAEGLGAVDGEHLLIADDADAFAAACARLLTDVEERRRLTDNGHRLLLERHQWSTAREAIGREAAALLHRTQVAPSVAGS